MTTLEIFAEYLMLRGYSIKSQNSIKNTVKYFLNWSDVQNIEPENISYNDILAYLDYCKKRANKQNTIQQAVSCISQYYNFLIHENKIKENPCSNVQIKGIKRKILHETFTPDELEIIYKTFDSASSENPTINHLLQRRNKVILALIIYQGIGTQELARLKITDVKIREGKIFVEGGRRINSRELS